MDVVPAQKDFFTVLFGAPVGVENQGPSADNAGDFNSPPVDAFPGKLWGLKTGGGVVPARESDVPLQAAVQNSHDPALLPGIVGEAQLEPVKGNLQHFAERKPVAERKTEAKKKKESDKNHLEKMLSDANPKFKLNVA